MNYSIIDWYYQISNVPQLQKQRFGILNFQISKFLQSFKFSKFQKMKLQYFRIPQNQANELFKSSEIRNLKHMGSCTFQIVPDARSHFCKTYCFKNELGFLLVIVDVLLQYIRGPRSDIWSTVGNSQKCQKQYRKPFPSIPQTSLASGVLTCFL